ESGKHTAADDAAAKKVKGWLKTIVNDQLVAVVATSYESAVKARAALKITWAPGPNAGVSSESIFRDFAAKAKDGAGAIEWHKGGDGAAAFAQAARVHQASYTTDYVAHMQMEPMNCVARFEGGVYDLYTGSQFQTLAMGTLAAVLKTDQKNIRIHQHYLGGGFGRRLDPDIILEAAIIAREAGRPIKLIRSREEDLRRAAERAGWGTPLPANVGRGLACVSAQEKKSPTWTASVVQARVDPATGQVRVEKIICAVDCGIVVNPDGVRSQVEGSLLFGLSNALKERGTVANGALVQSNFHDYQVLRMNDVP